MKMSLKMLTPTIATLRSETMRKKKKMPIIMMMMMMMMMMRNHGEKEEEEASNHGKAHRKLQSTLYVKCRLNFRLLATSTIDVEN